MTAMTTIPYSIIVERKLLPIEKVIRALKEAGFINISGHMVRRYLTIGLLERPRMGKASITRPRARYESYFSRDQIVAIAEIRTRLGRGYTLEAILEESVAARKKLQFLRKFYLEVQELAVEAVPFIDKCLNSNIDNESASRKSAIKLVSVVKNVKKREDKILSGTLGKNLDMSIITKIDAFIKNEFEEK